VAVKLDIEKDVLTAVLEGEIDHHSAKQIRESIDTAVTRLKPKILTLDFSGVGFMDSSGVGLIMGRHRLMSENGGRVEVTNARSNVLRMLKMAGLGRLGIKGII